MDTILNILKTSDYSKLIVNNKFLLWDNNSWRVFEKGLNKNLLILETENISEAIIELLEE